MSIADKLTTIAENTQKVYDAGYKKAVVTLCPPIDESGTLVQCNPLEGEPITIDVSNSGIEVSITICGKNLYDQKSYPLDINGYPYGVGTNQGGFSTSTTYRRTDFIPVAHLADQTIVQSHSANAVNPGMAFYTRIPDVKDSEDCRTACCGGTNGASIKVPYDAKYMVFCVRVENKNADVQIELGSVSTEHERYEQKQYTPVDVWKTEPLKGVNTIFAYDVEGYAHSVTVKGIADPTAEIKRLKERVNTLEKG
jgi:hypothetical protein